MRDPEGKRLVGDCLTGDAAARLRFQQQFGTLIYRFADWARGASPIEPGDFYLYLFEDDRLYRRLRSYEGRASLGAFLRGYTLPDLFKQFQIMIRRETVDTISLDSDCAREPVPLASAGDGASSAAPLGQISANHGTQLFAQLSPEKRLLVKLLYIEDFTLDAEDTQGLAQLSSRSVRDVIELVEQARESLRRREAVRQCRLDEAGSATQWILQYERRLKHAADELRNVPPRSTRAERLREEQAELARKRTWREQQRERARSLSMKMRQSCSEFSVDAQCS